MALLKRKEGRGWKIKRESKKNKKEKKRASKKRKSFKLSKLTMKCVFVFSTAVFI